MRCKAALGATVLLVLCAAGCTDSDVLSTGNSDTIVQVEVVNPQTRYNSFAEFTVSQFSVRPNDPASNASLGPAALATFEVGQPVKVLLNQPATQVRTLLLSTGSWRQNSLQLSSLFFIDSTPEPPPVTCDKQQFYQFNGAITLTAADLGPPTNLIVGPGAPPIRIQIDGAKLVEVFEDSFCTPTGGLRPTFDAAAQAYFRARVQTFLRIFQ